jgi:hypothetical protein
LPAKSSASTTLVDFHPITWVKEVMKDDNTTEKTKEMQKGSVWHLEED